MTNLHKRIRGATVARLTPDQKVACSIHVGFIFSIFGLFSYFYISLMSCEITIMPFVIFNIHKKPTPSLSSVNSHAIRASVWILFVVWVKLQI